MRSLSRIANNSCARPGGGRDHVLAEFRQPLGYTMAGGLVPSQMLTLYTTPVVYLSLDRLQTWLSGRKPHVAHDTQEPVVVQAAAE